MKIVINSQIGNFGLSYEATMLYVELKGFKTISLKDLHELFNEIKRNDPILIQVIEELGEKANGNVATLKIIEIPDDIEWEIEEYDGSEWISEKHRTWR